MIVTFQRILHNGWERFLLYMGFVEDARERVEVVEAFDADMVRYQEHDRARRARDRDIERLRVEMLSDLAPAIEGPIIRPTSTPRIVRDDE